jgi:hypothetical protein
VGDGQVSGGISQGKVAGLSTSLSGLVSKAGDTMTGQLNLTGASGNLVSQASVAAAGFFGDGANLTGLDAGNISAGTLSDSRLPGTMGAKTFSGLITADGGISLGAGQALSLSGSGGTITAASSVTASGFFGDGSSLSGVTASQVAASGVQAGALGAGVIASSVAAGAVGDGQVSGGISQGKVAGLSTSLSGLVSKAGDTMTGQLTLLGSTLTVTGNAFSVGGSVLVVKDGKLGAGVASPGVPFQAGNSLNSAGLEPREDGESIGGIAAEQLTRVGGFYLANPIPGAAISLAAQGPAGQEGAIGFATKNVNDDTTQPSYKMVIDKDGNVGIGTASPLHKLTLQEAVSAKQLYFKQANTDNGWILGTAMADGALRFFRRGEGESPTDNEMISILNGGNVGIGATAPLARLHVKGGGGSALPDDSGVFIDEDINGNPRIELRGASGKIPYVDFNRYGESTDYNFRLINVGNRALAFNSPGNEVARFQGDRLGIGTSAPLARLHVSSPGATSSDTVLLVSSGSSPGQDVFAVKGDGKVGIGTTAPMAMLSISQGAADASNGIANFLNSGLVLPGDYNFLAVGKGVSASGSALFGYTYLNPNSVAFMGVWSASIGYQTLNINAAGDVGVGTQIPAAKLDVNGSAQFGSGVGKSTFSAAGVLTLPADPTAALQAATKQYVDSWERSCANPYDANDVMVPVGPWCVDKYEASVWSSRTGGTQYGASSDNYPCNDNGQDCSVGAANPVYARSVVGVTPSRYLTWLQAQAACINSGKELLPNSIWQQAAVGTPDPGASGTAPNCNVSGGSPTTTGAGTNCVSAHGVMDMIGSLLEWVADWGAYVAESGEWAWNGDVASRSLQIVGPNGLLRGGHYANGASAGVFAINGGLPPTSISDSIGFRCGRRR